MSVTTRPAILDIARIREDFPILRQMVRGKKLVFLDSAASAQKPRVVIDAMVQAMETQYANVHRGLHWMSERTTEAYESARDAVAALMNANDRSEIIFTRNSTEALNLMAHSYGRVEQRGYRVARSFIRIGGAFAHPVQAAMHVGVLRFHRLAHRVDHRARLLR